ncbi:hypothetical protein ACLB2K_007371 [Fragaria x ananassa]
MVEELGRVSLQSKIIIVHLTVTSGRKRGRSETEGNSVQCAQSTDEGENHDVSVKKKKPRGRTCLQVMATGEKEKKLVEWNTKEQPVGAVSVKFSSTMGVIVREQVPIVIDNWHGVKDIARDSLWTLLMQKYMVDVCFKPFILQQMGKLWRSWKSELSTEIRKILELKSTKTERTNLIAKLKPHDVSLPEWDQFVQQRMSDKWLNGKLHQYCAPATGANVIEVHGQIVTLHGGAPRFPPRKPSVKRQCTTTSKILDIQRGVTITPSAWDQVIFRSEEDTINCHHCEPFIINVHVDHYMCHRALVDTGAAVSVMFSDCYKGLKRDRTKMYNNHDPLVSFSGETVQPLGSDRLTVSVGTAPCRSSITARFLIVDCPSSYNLILGRDILLGLQCFIAGHMLLMKVHTPGGTLTIQGDRVAIEHCHLNAIQQRRGAYEMLPLSPSEHIDDPRDDPEGTNFRKWQISHQAMRIGVWPYPSVRMLLWYQNRIALDLERWKQVGIADTIDLSFQLQSTGANRAPMMATTCFWDTSNNTFNFKFGKMGITLLDLYAIIGLPISDRPYQESDFEGEEVAFVVDPNRHNFCIPKSHLPDNQVLGMAFARIKTHDPLDYSDCFQHLYTMDPFVPDASELMLNRMYPEALANKFIWCTTHSLEAMHLFEQAISIADLRLPDDAGFELYAPKHFACQLGLQQEIPFPLLECENVYFLVLGKEREEANTMPNTSSDDGPSLSSDIFFYVV